MWLARAGGKRATRRLPRLSRGAGVLASPRRVRLPCPSPALARDNSRDGTRWEGQGARCGGGRRLGGYGELALGGRTHTSRTVVVRSRSLPTLSLPLSFRHANRHPPLFHPPTPPKDPPQDTMCPHTPSTAAAAAAGAADPAALKGAAAATEALASLKVADAGPLAGLFAADADPEARRAAAGEWAKSVTAAAAPAAVADLVSAAGAKDASPAAKEGAALGLAALAKAGGAAVEAALATALPTLFLLAGDKAAPVRDAAVDAISAATASIAPWAAKSVVPTILEATDTKHSWFTKVAALRTLGELSAAAPRQVGLLVPTIMPAASHAVSDAKPAVKDAAQAALAAVCATVGNNDIEKFIPVLISCIARPSEVADCVHKLGATTFVQAVEAPTLSVMVPLLLRGLRERVTAVRRKAAVITDNMAKLVDNPLDAAVFLPRLLPDLAKMADEVSDPEARGVAERARETLIRVGAEGADARTLARFAPADPETTRAALVKALADAGFTNVDAAIIDYVATAGCALSDAKEFLADEWACLAPRLEGVAGAKAAAITTAFLRACEVAAEDKAEEEDDDEGVDLCNCEFSLAYGGKILLNNARLRLKRGGRYGLCGANGCGKSTLMRAIANGQLDGFPPKDELRTVYVEHDIDASQAETPVVEFIFTDPLLQTTTAPPKAEVERMLSSVGFTEEMLGAPVASLSGGWKMKLALARARCS